MQVVRAECDHEYMKVVIIGGGFGGLTAARKLKDAPVDVVLLDRRNFHLFQPLLYQVATGGLSPANIAAPLRSILSKQENARIILAEATGFDPANRKVLLADGELDYDILVVSTGARHHYFGHPEWEETAPGLKTLEDALNIRRRILSAFEAAERDTDPARRVAWLTFVVVGGGPTGVELAGAIGEIAQQTLKDDYRGFKGSDIKVYLVEAVDRVLQTFPPELSGKAEQSLAHLGVHVLTSTTVEQIMPQTVVFKNDAGEQRIEAHTVLWAAGVQTTQIATKLAEATGAKTDRAGRIFADPDLTIAGHPEIFVIGDMAHLEQGGRPLPALAAVAMQQGAYVAKIMAGRLSDKPERQFHYRNRGTLATIGRSSAVADFGFVKLSGLPGWLVWLFVHIMNLAQFENRLLVITQWAWSYFTRGRSARLITDIEPTHEEPER